MAWTERYMCDVCGKPKRESEEWWLGMLECDVAHDGSPAQPTMRIQPWNNLLAHSAVSKHICGAVCAHKFLDRWMGELLSSDGPVICKEN